MARIDFHTQKTRTVIDTITFTREQFIKILNENKPTEIFNSNYSVIIPCWTITEYLENDRVKYFAHGWADKTPVEEPMSSIYTSWKIQGLTQCYFKLKD